MEYLPHSHLIIIASAVAPLTDTSYVAGFVGIVGVVNDVSIDNLYVVDSVINYTYINGLI